MAGREYKIDVVVDEHGSAERLLQVDAAGSRMAQNLAGPVKQDIAALNAQLDKMWGPAGTVAQASPIIQKTTTDWTAFEKGLNTAKVSELEADRALQELHLNLAKSPALLTQARTGLNEVATAAGLTYEKLGLLQSGFLAVGVGFGAYNLTKTVLEFTGLDKVIANTVGSLSGYDAILAAEVAGAKEEARSFQIRHLLNTIEQAPKILQHFHDEIAGLGPAMGTFVQDVDAGVLSLEQLHAKYGISTQAIKNFKVEEREAAEEAKHSADDIIKAHTTQARAAEALEGAYFKLHLNVARGMAEMTKQNDAMMAGLTKSVNDAVVAELEAQIKLNRAMGLDAYGAIIMQKSALDTLNEGLRQVNATRHEGISMIAREQVLQDAFAKSLYDEAVAADKARDAQAGLNATVAATPPVVDAAAVSIQAMAVTAATAAAIFGTLGEASAAASKMIDDAYNKAGFITHPMISGIPPSSASAAMLHYDRGGPVLRDGPIYAHAGEFVVPRGGGGGGGPIAITIDARGATFEDDLALDRLADKLQRKLGELYGRR